MAEPQRPQTSGPPPPLPAAVNDLWETILTYARQQTLDPLRQLGRYIGYGVAGALLVGLGLVFLALGGLRALQVELGGHHGHLSGNWTWVPYGAAGVLFAVVAVVMATRINKVPSERKR